MDKLNNDRDVIDNGRETLLDEADYSTPLRDQIVKKLFKKLEDMEIGHTVRSMWTRASSDRTTWLDRQAEWLSNYDEFINVEPSGLFDASSNLHVPMTLWVLKAYHARFLQALFSPEPSISVKARKAAYSDLGRDAEDFLKYTLIEWANGRRGVEEAVDQWIWSWLSSGIGYLKERWECLYKKYDDVEIVKFPGPDRIMQGPDGNSVVVPTTVDKEKEITRIVKTFEGPMIEFIPIEDVIVIGPDMSDTNGADAVIHRQYLTASDLWLLVERKLFDKSAVEEIIDGGADHESGTEGDALKFQRLAHSGEASLDKDYDLDRYEILEAYISIDVDGTGINSDVIVWVHKRSGRLLRATYLHRMNKAGERPIIAAMFHKRSGTNKHMPIGLVEMLYPIQKELDAIHNMRIDFGLLSTVPFGFYRASSSLNPKELKLTPGALYPLDNPQLDVVFPNLGNRTVTGFQEEQALFTFVERLTGISDISLGAMSGTQGATRTATGVQALVGESNTNLNTPLKRLNRGWKSALEYLWHMLQQRTPAGLEYRVTGDDGIDKYKLIVDPNHLAGDFDIEVSPTTEASNKSIQVNNATQIMQMVQNPLLLQIGVVTPVNVYEGVKNYLKVIGIKDHSKFISSSFENQVTLSPKEEVQRVVAGQDVPVLPASDHQGVAALIQTIFDNDDYMGQLTEKQAMLLKAHQDKHLQMAAAIKQQQANAAAASQMRMNSSMASQQTNPGANSMAPSPSNMPAMGEE